MSSYLFPYIYEPDKSINVCEESKKYIKENSLQEKISNLGWIYHSVGKLIPHHTENLWSGHFFPWSESWEELQISFNLCLFGFYKQSMFAIRSASELGLLSVYWNLNDKGHEVIQTWLDSKEDTPRLQEIWNKLIQHPSFEAFTKEYDLKKDLMELNHLHDWVHSKGFDYSNKIGLDAKPNSQSFEEHGFELWITNYEKVIRILSICHLIKYPIGTIKYDWSRKFGIDVPSFGGLDIPKVERLESFLGGVVFKIIHNIAKENEYVQETLNEVSSLNDIREEEVNEQIINLEKMMIKQNGLQNWLKEQERLIGPIDEASNNYKKRVKELIKWAKGMGYEKSILERKGISPPST